MKKLYAIAICFVLLAVSFTSVFAGKWVDPVNAPFYLVPSGTSNIVSSDLAGGKVHIVDPMGNASLIIQGNIVGLLPNTSYDVWVRNLNDYTGDYLQYVPSLGYFKFVTLTTDDFGNADFHIMMKADELPDGTYQIQVAINPAGVLRTVIATQWPGYMVTVDSK